MSAAFTEGFFVRVPAWHQLGIVLDDYPGREEAMRLAGHDFEVVELPIYGSPTDFDPSLDPATTPDSVVINGFKHLVKRQLRNPEDCDATHGKTIGVVRNSFTPVQNPVPWDIIDALMGVPNVKYETGATLHDGAQCFVTAVVDEPRQVTGDDSPIYPYVAVNWAHDGSGAVKAIRTSVREVCANTVALAEAEASRSGLEFVFRHTRNVHDRIADAKMALQGIGDVTARFIEVAEELAVLGITERQRTLFLAEFIPTPPEALISERVAANIEEARNVVRTLLASSPTIPDAHRETGYGLLNAGIEYLDHLRGYRNSSTYVGRTLLRQEPLKAKLVPLIREVAARLIR